MQLDGPTEWCAWHAHSGTRPNDLLQQGALQTRHRGLLFFWRMQQLIAWYCCCVAYNGVLGMTAMPDEASSVVLTKYAREDAMDACDVSCIAVDHLSLHPAETVSA